MDQLQAYTQKATTYLKNPYVVGVCGILAVVYGSLMAPQLPPTVASWFANPIFKVLFIFLILAVRNIDPTVSIILTLGLIISMQTLNRYRVFTMANEVSQLTAQNANRKPVEAPIRAPMPPRQEQEQPARPSADELSQINQELLASMNTQEQSEAVNRTEVRENLSMGDFGFGQASPASAPQAQPASQETGDSIPDAKLKQKDALHPMNRPDWETNALKPRIEDPNDPRHPGWNRFGSNVDSALYELNPCYLKTNLPNQFGNAKGVVKDKSGYYPAQYEQKAKCQRPKGGPSRYSAYHGYPAVPEQTEGFESQSQQMYDFDNNKPSPNVPKQNQGLPDSYMADPSLPNPENMQYETSAPLNPNNNNHSGPQGLQYQSGVQYRRGAEYGTPSSEL